MKKTILLTGATDGIGLETAKLLLERGHNVLIHGRSDTKLAATKQALARECGVENIETYRADLSKRTDIETLAAAVAEQHEQLDVLINNAGVFSVANTRTDDGLDVRFMVNTLAPYLLTKLLLPLLPSNGRVINLSSAAQATVNADALAGNVALDDNQAYAQSKLAITMWSAHLGKTMGSDGPVVVAVNPASLLASKMVKDAYGIDGSDLRIGADILVTAALGDSFADASGKYFDNDQKRFAAPHRDATDDQKNAAIVAAIEATLTSIGADR
ncbi:MAG: SDR family NAD(P)-dependent oxidoreductase [Pseudomonadota bacterium]